MAGHTTASGWGRWRFPDPRG
uniref:Uncharacterized protein n=1 Tax=Arundo donax TaxID=35708 RepID=A0A0A9C4I6_ARUDO